MSTLSSFTDTHAHLYDAQYSAHLDEVIARSQEAGVTRIYMPSLNEKTVLPMCRIEERYPTLCRAMLGLHPCDVGVDYREKLLQLAPWLERHAFVAIGEVGLDFHHTTAYKKEQQRALEHQLEWARFHQLPAVLHARNSLEEVITTIKKSKIPQGIVHCFAGTRTQAQKIIDLGFHLGIGGLLTFPRSDLPAIIQELSISALVLETDSPYLAPHPHRGKRNEPSYIRHIASALAAYKELSLQEVMKATTKAAQTIFRT